MSIMSFIASDHLLSETKEIFLCTATPHSASQYECFQYTKKKYVYMFEVSLESSGIDYLITYLQNILIEEVEIWTIWLGGDYTKRDMRKTTFKNISSKEIDFAIDAMDWYRENYPFIERRQIWLNDLEPLHIEWLFDNTSVCLTIKNHVNK